MVDRINSSFATKDSRISLVSFFSFSLIGHRSFVSIDQVIVIPNVSWGSEASICSATAIAWADALA